MDRVSQFLKSVSLGNMTEIEEFLKCGYSVDCQDNEGTSPLQVAAANGADHIVLHLLSENASVDLANRSGWTPLMLAASGGHTSTVLHLIKFFAKINIYNIMGLTPLIAAVSSGNVSTVKVLLENGAITDHLTSMKPSYFNITPLMMAALRGYEPIVHILLDAGASVDCISTVIGWSPLMCASCSGHDNIIKILIDAGADETKTNILGQTASDIAMQASQRAVKASQRAVKASLENVWTKSADIVPKEEKIWIAVQNGNLDEVKSIISDSPISMNYANPKDMVSILMVAAMNGYSDIVKVLIQNGCDLDIQDETNGWTALMHAAHNKHFHIVKQLIDGEADVNAKSKTGYTVFDLMNCLDKSDKHITEALTVKMTESLDFTGPELINSAPTVPIVSYSKSFSFFPRSPRRSQRSTHTKDWISNTTIKFSTMFSRSSTKRSNSPSVPVIKITDSVANDDVFESSDAISANNSLPTFQLSLPTLKSPDRHLVDQLKNHSIKIITSPLVTKETFQTESATLMAENNRHISKNQKRSVPTLSASALLKDYVKNEIPKTPTCIPRDLLQVGLTAYKKENVIRSRENSPHHQFPNSAPCFQELQLTSNDDNAQKDKLKNQESVSDLLRGNSLEKHVDKFKQQEIDMTAIKLINKEDLLEMGIDSTLSHEALCEILRNLQRTSDV